MKMGKKLQVEQNFSDQQRNRNKTRLYKTMNHMRTSNKKKFHVLHRNK